MSLYKQVVIYTQIVNSGCWFVAELVVKADYQKAEVQKHQDGAS